MQERTEKLILPMTYDDTPQLRNQSHSETNCFIACDLNFLPVDRAKVFSCPHWIVSLILASLERGGATF